MARPAVAVLVALVLSSCGGGSPPAPSGGATITITAAGASPLSVTIAPGSRVMFVNDDSRPHNMTSDPHPEHNDCPELNTVGLLQPGQRRESGNLNATRTCGFHDHDDPPPAGSRFAGQIVIR